MTDAIKSDTANDMANSGEAAGDTHAFLLDYQWFLHATEPLVIDLETGMVEGGGDAYDGTFLRSGISDVLGGPYDDVLIGDGRDNYLSGREGSDTVFGGDGNDSLHGEFVSGGQGDDTIWTETPDLSRAHSAVAYGEAGDDHISGDVDASNTLFGGDGDDKISVVQDDVLSPSTWSNTLFGGDGDDTLNTRTWGHNYVYGGNGDDTLGPGMRGDHLDGGTGNDTYSMLHSGRMDPVFVDLETGHVEGGDFQGVSVANIENFYGVQERAEVYGTEGVNSLHGGQGDDVLFGRGGDDFLEGNENDDLLDGGAGRDRLEGGANHDILSGGDGHDILQGGLGDDVLEGGDGNDFLRGDLPEWADPSNPDVTGQDTFLWRDYEGGAERDRIVDFDAGPDGDKIELSAAFQDKSGIHGFDDFIAHSSQNDAGVYVDFADGRDYGYGVQIDGIELSDLFEDNVQLDSQLSDHDILSG